MNGRHVERLVKTLLTEQWQTAKEPRACACGSFGTKNLTSNLVGIIRPPPSQ